MSSYIKRVSLIGTHGSGKGYIRENYSLYSEDDRVLDLPPHRSYVSAQWESFELPNLREIPTINRIKHQYLLVGAAECHYRENETGLFERSPLDILGYTYFLVDELLEQASVTSIDELDDEILKHEINSVLSFVKEKVFFLTNKFVDVLAYVPIDPDIFEMRGDYTDHREVPENAYPVDEYMKQSLLEYFGGFQKSSKNTKLIVINGCKPHERVGLLNDSLNLIRNGQQFVFNGHKFFTTN